MDEETRKKLGDWNNQVGESLPVDADKEKPHKVSRFSENLEEDSSETPTQKEPSPSTPLQKEIDAEMKGEDDTQKYNFQDKDTLKRLRTFETDAAEHVKKEKTSLSSVVIAQEKRTAAEEKEATENSVASGGKKTLISAVLSIALIAGGIGALYGWYVFSQENRVSTQIDEAAPSIINPNRTQKIILSNESREDLIGVLESFEDDPGVVLGEIVEPYFVKEQIVTTEDGEEVVVEENLSAREFLEILDSNTPLSFFRSLESEFMYGVHVFDDAQPFMILRTDFYQNAFASMLNWEETIEDDLSFLVRELPDTQAEIEEDLPPSDSTATTSTSTAPQPDVTEEPLPLFQASFKDEVLFNQDTRVLRNEAGEITLLYSFPRENILVITGNEDTFEEILKRLNVATFRE